MSAPVAIVRPEEAETVWVLGDRLRFMGTVAGTDLHVVEVTVPPGSGTPPHRHTSIEIFHVTEGEVTFGMFDGGPPSEVRGGAGAVVTVASNAAHNYSNRGSTNAVMLAVVQRQMHDFFAELGASEAPPPGPPSAEAMAHILAVCARHGVEMLRLP
jgi:quercetin dioxygenase-like cupin family protein